MASRSSGSKSKGLNLKETTVRYRECWRNHAVLIGGYAADGCGEFTPKGDEGTQEALLCEACDCHRNFHRKELIEDGKALVSSSHHLPSPMMLWGDSDDFGGSYPLPSAVSQPELSPYHHQQYSQDAVSDEESAIYSGSQGEMERKESKKTKRKKKVNNYQ